MRTNERACRHRWTRGRSEGEGKRVVRGRHVFAVAVTLSLSLSLYNSFIIARLDIVDEIRETPSRFTWLGIESILTPQSTLPPSLDYYLPAPGPPHFFQIFFILQSYKRYSSRLCIGEKESWFKNNINIIIWENFPAFLNKFFMRLSARR